MRCRADIPRGFAGYLRAVRHLVVAVTAAAGLGVVAPAQVNNQVPSQLTNMLSPDQLQMLQQQQQRSATQPSVMPRETILEPTAPSAPQPISDLEVLMSTRAGMPLHQFGYDLLGVGRAVNLPQVGALQDSYIVGVGDEVVLTLRGQENSEYRTEVNRDGNLVFPRLAPVSAAGRSLAQVRQDLMNTIRRAYVSTEGYVTIGRVRQISVLVSGEVRSPGVRTLTGLSTVVDAVFVSGGIKKSGSLRNIHILRGDRDLTVDLYSLLVDGVHSKNLSLADGDKIVVPAVGATVAITGETRRKGIFELPAGRKAISARDVQALASGTTVRGSYRVSLLRTRADGTRLFVDITGEPHTLVGDGEVVQVKTAVNISLNQVSLRGAVRAPGMFALNRFRTLHDLLPSNDALLPGAYMLLGIIDRTDPSTLQRVAIPFSPMRVVQGRDNADLKSDDVIHVLTPDGMRTLIRVLELNSPNAAKPGAKPGDNANNGLGTPAASLPGASLPSSNLPNSGMPNAGMPNAGMSNGSQQNYNLPNTGMPNSSLVPGGSSMNTMPSAAPPGASMPSAGMPGGNSPAGNLSFGPPSASPPPYSVGSDQDANANLQGINTNQLSPPLSTDDNTDIGGFKASDALFFARLMSEFRVAVAGAVREPGVYLIAPGTTLSDAVSAAGGFTKDVDLSNLELTTTTIDNMSGVSTTTRRRFAATPEALAGYVLQPLDAVLFRRVFSEAEVGAVVTIRGEVHNPGTYGILRHEHLSSVLERAGGLTQFAYPYGAVFTRVSVADQELAERAREATDLRSQLFNVVLRPNTNSAQYMPGETMAALENLLRQIQTESAIGRVSVIPDPEELRNHPETDIILEPGDTIVVPKRPSTVTVLGEVLQPGTFVWDKNAAATDYIDRAGGLTTFADSSRIIAILPDGTARAVSSSWLSLGLHDDVPVGSTIVVFRDFTSLPTHQLITDVTAIMSQLATSAAALAVLSKY